MGKFDKYKVDLKGISSVSYEVKYLLDNQFFADIDAPEVTKGNVNVELNVRKLAGESFELNFQIEGVVLIPCDRCLDDMEQQISTVEKLKVKLGADYAEDGDWVIIPEDEGEINVAWFVYEFIALSIPMKHVHAPGKCNKGMYGKLSQHLCVSVDEEAEESSFGGDAEYSTSSEIDPRWNELKKILDNN